MHKYRCEECHKVLFEYEYSTEKSVSLVSRHPLEVVPLANSNPDVKYCRCPSCKQAQPFNLRALLLEVKEEIRNG